MTVTTNFPQLALLTLRDPSAAARIILDWQMPREAIWTAIALVSVVVTMLSTLSNMLFPTPAPLDVLISSPFIYFIIAAGGFVLSAYAIYWTGRMLGGQGAPEDLLVLLLWLQAMRAGAQLVVLLLLLLAPALASFFVLFVAAATMWIFVHFISIGLRLNSLLRALFVLIIGAAILVVGLTFLLSLIGVSAVGVPLNV